MTEPALRGSGAPINHSRSHRTLTSRQSSAVDTNLGEDVVGALVEMVRTVEELPGQFKAEFRLKYWSGVVPPAEAWACTVEGDIEGDDGEEFTILGRTAADTLRRAAAEAWRRVPRKPEQ